MLEIARIDLLAFPVFPRAPCRQAGSTTPLESAFKEIKHRSEARTTFLTPAARLRLAGHILSEQYDEWDPAERLPVSEQSMKILDGIDGVDGAAELRNSVQRPHSQLTARGIEELHN